MAALVSLEQMRRHLNLTETDMEDEDVAGNVELYRQAATDIVIDYIKRPAHGWDEETAPYLVKAAILLVGGSLFEDRENAGLSNSVRSLLARYRDPALA